ncbi:MAG TPA: HAD family hydrolase [Acidimicrobiales bacterium]
MSEESSLEALDPTGLEAVSLDVGGVLVVPDQDLLADALGRAGIAFDRTRFTEGHYRAMAEVDRCMSTPEVFTDYHRGFLRAIGTPDDQLESGAAVLESVLTPMVWYQRIPGAVEAGRRLAAAGVRLGVTSNADGRVERLLREHGVAQVGEGPGVPVEVVTDSGVLGAHKPDPSMFLATAAGLDLPPERICHIGDSAYYDAEGAAAVGMVAVHVDPLGLCSGRHLHARSLAELADRLVPRDDTG